MYEPDEKKVAQIESAFTYHKPQEGQPERYVQIRDTAKELAMLILTLSPGSREQSVALTKLEEVVMWTNAAISRNE